MRPSDRERPTTRQATRSQPGQRQCCRRNAFSLSSPSPAAHQLSVVWHPCISALEGTTRSYTNAGCENRTSYSIHRPVPLLHGLLLTPDHSPDWLRYPDLATGFRSSAFTPSSPLMISAKAATMGCRCSFITVSSVSLCVNCQAFNKRWFTRGTPAAT